jgi:putative oxidoreductase
MIERLLSTDSQNRTLLAQRLVLAGVMLPHGAQKLLGWFGGYGFDGTVGFLTGVVGLPYPLAVLVVLIEAFGPLLLALGLGTRLAALGFTAIMIGAIVTTHLPYGFFMNWGGQSAGEGFEYHLLALGLSLPLTWLGGGHRALDTVIASTRWRRAPLAPTPSLAS